MNNKERIIELVKKINRKGVDKVLDYLETSNYFTRGCCGHHIGAGGLAQHSLEVYDSLCRCAGNYPLESVAVVALFHDLGKTRSADREHGQHSIDILEECGFVLTEVERDAIAGHHNHSFVAKAYVSSKKTGNPQLAWLLSKCDMESTGSWKDKHGGNASRRAVMFSKLCRFFLSIS